MSNETQPSQPHIGTLNEGSLHADLKQHYWEPGDLTEAPLGGFVVDLLRTQNNKNIIIEIQTTAFASMRKRTQCSTRYLQNQHRLSDPNTHNLIKAR